MNYGWRNMEGLKTEDKEDLYPLEDVFDEAFRDVKKLIKRISSYDYKTLNMYLEKKSFTLIAYMLRRYGIEFKGLTHLETMVSELIKMKEQKKVTQGREL